jgi:hypothetical protein
VITSSFKPDSRSICSAVSTPALDCVQAGTEPHPQLPRGTPIVKLLTRFRVVNVRNDDVNVVIRDRIPITGPFDLVLNAVRVEPAVARCIALGLAAVYAVTEIRATSSHAHRQRSRLHFTIHPRTQRLRTPTSKLRYHRRKTATPTIHKPKAKSNASTKPSNAGWPPAPDRPPSPTCTPCSTPSPSSTTPNAPAARPAPDHHATAGLPRPTRSPPRRPIHRTLPHPPRHRRPVRREETLVEATADALRTGILSRESGRWPYEAGHGTSIETVHGCWQCAAFSCECLSAYITCSKAPS